MTILDDTTSSKATASKRKLHLHRFRAVAGKLKGLDRGCERQRCGDQWFYADQAFAHQAQCKLEFRIEAERPAQLQFFCYDRVHRQRHCAAEPELLDDGPGAQESERGTQRRLVAGSLEQNIEHALARAIGIEL